MAYIGKGPEEVLSGVASKSTFTGDGSTTVFDITTDIPAGGENDIQVFVDNVRQEPGSGASYTVGVDGSGNLRRITFNTAPEASQSIYVINPRRIEAFGQVPDNTIATAKVQDNAVTVAKLASTLDLSSNTLTLPNDVVNADKIADDAISEEHLDNTVVTGFGDLGTNIAASDQIIVYDQSSGTLKKISQTNFLNFPVVSSVSPTSVTSGDGTGNYTFTITGTGFTGATADLLNASGTAVAFDSVTVDSATQITGVIAKSSLPGSGEPYDVRVTAASGLKSTLDNQINIDQSPTFVTASGSLGSQLISTAGSFSVNATDPESAGNVTFELQSGSLPPGYSITNTAAEGGTAIISGTDSTTSSTTTFNFVLRAVDAASNTSSRSFSIQSRILVSESFTSSGTFSVPSGITSADVLVVAGAGGGGYEGGGGGAGGLIFFPSYPVTPSGTITVTVGCGGAGAPSTGQSGTIAGVGQSSVFGSPGDPGLGQGGVLTTIGGGSGGTKNHPCSGGGRHGRSGGSGGGTARDSTGSAGCGTQPTQPGNSGAYGFGNPGGRATGSSGHSAGGGGGAGAVGQDSFSPDSAGGPYPGTGSKGGIGKAYTIADGTTSVYYAGGGSGGANTIANAVPGPAGGGGGFGGSPGSGNYSGQPGQANRGGGGGGAGLTPGQSTGGTGGKGIVIVRY